MADKDSEENLSLQLPSFGFGRKKPKDEPVELEAAAPKTMEAVEPTKTVAPEPSPAPSSSSPAKREVMPPPSPAPVPARGRVERAEPYVRPPAASTVTQTQPIPVDAPARRGPSFPAIAALQAVLAVGAVIGILGVLLTFGSLKFCELVGGTDSCGGPGWLLLLATLVVLTYVGAWLLRGFGIDDPGSTSFLAVALLAVLTMVFFLDVIYSWWMILVIPPVSMAMYALSWRVTGFVDTDDEAPT